jgi:hypothetical protein
VKLIVILSHIAVAAYYAICVLSMVIVAVRPDQVWHVLAIITLSLACAAWTKYKVAQLTKE